MYQKFQIETTIRISFKESVTGFRMMTAAAAAAAVAIAVAAAAIITRYFLAL